MIAQKKSFQIQPLKKKIVTAMYLFACIVLVAGCGQQREAEKKPELLIYCGITMMQPMKEIASIMEQKQGCTIRFITGGSGGLLRAIESNQVGDLYLPGAASYIQHGIEKKLLTNTTVLVGYNQAALMVQKGNPLQINADLANLTDSSLNVILSDPDTGSIGRESKKILSNQGIFQEVIANSTALVADSKDITNALKNSSADISINWYATALWPENKDFVDAILLDKEIAPRKKLVIGLLSFSRQPELAKHFMDYASSQDGKNIFRQYGFLQPSDLRN